jgi:hypothetical protein
MFFFSLVLVSSCHGLISCHSKGIETIGLRDHTIIDKKSFKSASIRSTSSLIAFAKELDAAEAADAVGRTDSVR